MKNSRAAALCFFAGMMLTAAPAVLAQQSDERAACEELDGGCKDAATKVDNVINKVKNFVNPPPAEPKAEVQDEDAVNRARIDAEMKEQARIKAETDKLPHVDRARYLADLAQQDHDLALYITNNCKDVKWASGAGFKDCQQALTKLNILEFSVKGLDMGELEATKAAKGANYTRNRDNLWAGEPQPPVAAAQPKGAVQTSASATFQDPNWNNLGSACVGELSGPTAHDRAVSLMKSINTSYNLRTPGSVQDHLDGIPAQGSADQNFTRCILRERLKELNGAPDGAVLKRGGKTGADMMKTSLDQAEAWEAERPAREAKAKADAEALDRQLAELNAKAEADRQYALQHPQPVVEPDNSDDGSDVADLILGLAGVAIAASQPNSAPVFGPPTASNDNSFYTAPLQQPQSMAALSQQSQNQGGGQNRGLPVTPGGQSCASMSVAGTKTHTNDTVQGTVWTRYDYQMRNQCGQDVTVTVSYNGVGDDVRLKGGQSRNWFCTVGFLGNTDCPGGRISWSSRWAD